MTGFYDPFESPPEPPTAIDALLNDPSPSSRLWKTGSEWPATGDRVIVTFSYANLSLGQAKLLWSYLMDATEYLVKVVASDVAGEWSVEGRLRKPIYLTSKFVDDWVKWMAAVGASHSAGYFDWNVARNQPPQQPW